MAIAVTHPQRVSSQNPPNKTFSTFWREKNKTKNAERIILLSDELLFVSSMSPEALMLFCLASGPVLLPPLHLSPSIFLTLAPSISLILSITLPLLFFCLSLFFSRSLSLFAHFSFWRLRIPAAPLREVCENAQCRSPSVPTPAQSVRRGPCIWCLTDQIFCQIARPFYSQSAPKAWPEVVRKERGRHSNCIKVCRDCPTITQTPPLLCTHTNRHTYS